MKSIKRNCECGGKAIVVGNKAKDSLTHDCKPITLEGCMVMCSRCGHSTKYYVKPNAGQMAMDDWNQGIVDMYSQWK